MRVQSGQVEGSSSTNDSQLVQHNPAAQPSGLRGHPTTNNTPPMLRGLSSFSSSRQHASGSSASAQPSAMAHHQQPAVTSRSAPAANTAARLSPPLAKMLTATELADVERTLGPRVRDLSTVDKTALWVARLNTRSDFSTTMVEELNDAMSQGLSHAVWGSKPAQYLEQGLEGGIYPHIAKVKQEYGLDAKFALIPVAERARQHKGRTFEGPSGWLVNTAHMYAAVVREKALLTRYLRCSPDTPDLEVYQRLLAHLPNMSYPVMDRNLEVAATLLGFGRSNGVAVDQSKLGRHPEITRFHTEVENMLNQAYEQEGADSRARYPQLPQFTKYDSAETRALLNRYLGESRRVHADLNNTITACEPLVSDGHSLERIEVARLLATLSGGAA
ncbi:hypothetical protein PQQ51_33650 [Paraburkholderia xenovorans]|uniref:hypothetical protein n=1 Tax=Paraburkholderia xenovorans TaxID=36873 RepID=UPI0038B77E0E